MHAHNKVKIQASIINNLDNIIENSRKRRLEDAEKQLSEILVETKEERLKRVAELLDGDEDTQTSITPEEKKTQVIKTALGASLSEEEVRDIKHIISEEFKSSNDKDELFNLLKIKFHTDHKPYAKELANIIQEEYGKSTIHSSDHPNLNELKEYISAINYYTWAYKRFFLNNDAESFKEFCSNINYLINKLLENNKDDVDLKMLLGFSNNIQSRAQYIDALGKDSATPKHVKLITKTIAILSQEISEREPNDILQLQIDLCNHLTGLIQECCNNTQTTNKVSLRIISMLYPSIHLLESSEPDQKIIDTLKDINTESPATILDTLNKECEEIIDRNKQMQEEGKQSSEETPKILQNLKSKLNKLEAALKPNTINVGTLALLYLIYIAVFATFSVYIQAAAFGTVLLGGSMLTNIMFGMVASLVATPLAITIYKLRNKIDSNKLFNLILLCSIFAGFAFIAPSIELLLLGNIVYTTAIAYKFMLALIATYITYNVLNIFELLIKSSISGAHFIILSFIKDIVRELSLIFLFTPIVDPLLSYVTALQINTKVVAQDIMPQEADFIKTINSTLLGFIIASLLSTYTGAILAPIIGANIVYDIILFISYQYLLSQLLTIIIKTPEINLPLAYTKLLDFTARQITKAYNFIEACLDHSVLITESTISIFKAYRDNVPAKLPTYETKNKYVSYAIFAATSIFQAIIDVVFLPIFIVAYPIYRAAELLVQNVKNVGANNPIRTTIFFIATAALCATFASPIQLFVLGQLVMTGSPTMNILFGTMSGLVSTMFGANACVATNYYVVPPVSKAFNRSYETVHDFCVKTMPCFDTKKSPKA